MVSPGRKPASTAGLGGGSAQFGVPSSQTAPASGPDWTIGTSQASSREAVWASAGSTQSGTAWIVVVGCRMPKPMSRTVKKTTASTRLLKGPANMTITRCHQGLA
jgi:hypothetical protein